MLDDNQVRRAQDFTDLQNNAKPLNQSVAQSMDRRETLNRVLLENVIKGTEVPAFDCGQRVEFLTDSPGKLSAKIASYKTIRYASGTLLVGTAHRSTKSWSEAVDLVLSRDQDGATEQIIAFWQGYSDLPAVSRALTIEKGVALLREDTWLTSAYVMYALGAAIHTAGTAGIGIADAFHTLAAFDFSRSGTRLHGTRVDPPLTTGGAPKARTGRDAWESASLKLAGFIHEQATGRCLIRSQQAHGPPQTSRLRRSMTLPDQWATCAVPRCGHARASAAEPPQNHEHHKLSAARRAMSTCSMVDSGTVPSSSAKRWASAKLMVRHRA